MWLHHEHFAVRSHSWLDKCTQCHLILRSHLRWLSQLKQSHHVDLLMMNLLSPRCKKIIVREKRSYVKVDDMDKEWIKITDLHRNSISPPCQCCRRIARGWITGQGSCLTWFQNSRFPFNLHSVWGDCKKKNTSLWAYFEHPLHKTWIKSNHGSAYTER